jgi:hypothetical protein
LALLEHQAEEDLSVPTGWKKSRHSQTATTKASQRGRALIVDMKRAVPTHSHNFQAFRGKNLCEEHSLAKKQMTIVLRLVKLDL